MQAASKLNTEEIEQIAREKLGMEKVADGQTSYISLTQDDEGTVVQAERHRTCWTVSGRSCSRSFPDLAFIHTNFLRIRCYFAA